LPRQVAFGVLHVDAVGAGVLRHHQQFADAAAHQLLGFAQHLVDRARHQVAAHRGMMQKLQRWLQPSEIFRYA
jgi:hypothetical protein